MGITPGARVVLAELHDNGVTADGAEIVAVTPAQAGLMRVTCCFRVAAKLRVRVNDEINMFLNSGQNLGAACASTFEFDAVGGQSYSFRPVDAGPNVDKLVVSLKAY